MGWSGPACVWLVWLALTAASESEDFMRGVNVCGHATRLAESKNVGHGCAVLDNVRLPRSILVLPMVEEV
jgi:hypothetical protein